MMTDEIEKTIRLAVAKAVNKVIFSQKEAAEYLGHGADWLRGKAAGHALYRPSVGSTKRGSAAVYHKAHLDIILQHMLTPDLLTKDEALRSWKRKLVDAAYEMSAPPPKKRLRKTS